MHLVTKKKKKKKKKRGRIISNNKVCFISADFCGNSPFQSETILAPLHLGRN